MKKFLEELSEIEKQYIDFFDKNKIGITGYIKMYHSPAMVELNEAALLRHPMPEEIRKKIAYLILNPRRLRTSKYAKSKKQ
jgi:hypothetical protein